MLPRFDTLAFSNRVTERIQSIEDVRYLRNQVGPYPRDIIHFTRDPLLYEECMMIGAARLLDLESFKCLLSATFVLVDASKQLFVVDRASPLHKKHLESDSCSICPRGDIALDMLMTRLLLLSSADVRELLQFCSASRNGAPFLDLAFKQYAIR